MCIRDSVWLALQEQHEHVRVPSANLVHETALAEATVRLDEDHAACALLGRRHGDLELFDLGLAADKGQGGADLRVDPLGGPDLSLIHILSAMQ